MVFYMFIFFVLSTLANSPQTSCSESDLRSRLTNIDLVFSGSCTTNKAGETFLRYLQKPRSRLQEAATICNGWKALPKGNISCHTTVTYHLQHAGVLRPGIHNRVDGETNCRMRDCDRIC